ncbi:MAG: dethiobiotin synthase [Rhodospirillaceae bacterium]|nr:dethiobiotin synthase [Rhodospirillaceae bacterium]
MKKFFITSTGTEIGKTVVTTTLAWQARKEGKRVRVLKPVISGFDEETCNESDTAQILQCLDIEQTQASIESISPWRFKAPLSPDMAAAREGTPLEFNSIINFCQEKETESNDLLLIEGVGGLMVPLTDSRTVLDWIKALGYPVIIVVGSYLGTISHTLTTVETAQKFGLNVASIVISESENSPVPIHETANAIKRFLTKIPILELPRLAPSSTPWQEAPELIIKNP